MHAQQLEAMTKAAQCADLLAQDLREAHRLAARHLPILAILLDELLGQVTQIRDRLAELHSTGAAARGGCTTSPQRGRAVAIGRGRAHPVHRASTRTLGVAALSRSWRCAPRSAESARCQLRPVPRASGLAPTPC
ncbi:MAG: hypothetical protein M5U12_12655 [Verrucomicrobia bacterium]|nr:hypothetical protein [Verrucomicrobiota bacterium]